MRDDDARAALRAAILVHSRTPLARHLDAARRGLGPYRGYGEVLGVLERLEARGARLVQIGRSVRGEPIFAVHVGSALPGARTAVVLSAVHPIEWIGLEVCLALLERLVQADLAGRALVAVPVVNPDGLLKVEHNLRAGRHRFVRYNARGVDLNRNFDAHWGARGPLHRALSWLFAPGSRPASEPEVEAVAQHLSPRRIDRAVSLHSFGGMVLYPPGGSYWPVADAAEHRAWARRIAAAAPYHGQRAYRATPAAWWWGMRLGGLELDWFHDRHGALSLLVECSRGGFWPPRPSRLVEPFAWFNPPRVDRVTGPLVEALVPFVRGAELPGEDSG
jgi:hypothetical protein